jgi:hypothetical protein
MTDTHLRGGDAIFEKKMRSLRYNRRLDEREDRQMEAE